MEHDQTVVLDCSPCVERETATCEDCVVRLVCQQGSGDEDGGGAEVIDVEEARALRMLGRAGLVEGWGQRRRAG